MSEEKKKCAKCSKKECYEYWQAELSKCEDWETKKKKLITDLIEKGVQSQDELNWIECHSTSKLTSLVPGVIYSAEELCSSCGANLVKKNNCGDIKEIEAKHTPNCQASDLNLDNNQIKSNQIKSNQIKSNQIKSNQQLDSSQNIDTQTTQKPNNSKLYLGIGLGVLGGSLVGLIAYFLTRKKAENKG